MNNNTNNKKPDPQMVEFYHAQGWMPDSAYYQLNGKSATENYIEQRNKIMQKLTDDDDDLSEVCIISEVNIKK